MSNKKEGSRQGSGSKKRDNSKGKNVVNMFGKSPILQRTSFKERTRLELLDWKESFCYKSYLDNGSIRNAIRIRLSSHMHRLETGR